MIFNLFVSKQVLPDRTHPMTSMNHLGGYLLTGLHVAKWQMDVIDSLIPEAYKTVDKTAFQIFIAMTGAFLKI